MGIIHFHRYIYVQNLAVLRDATGKSTGIGYVYSAYAFDNSPVMMHNTLNIINSTATLR